MKFLQKFIVFMLMVFLMTGMCSCVFVNPLDVVKDSVENAEKKDDDEDDDIVEEKDDDDKKPITEYIDGMLPNQISNHRFYYQQGYLDTWEIAQQGSEEFAIDEKTGLCLVLEPKENKGDVQYAIYVHTDAPISMTDSASSVTKKVMDEENADFAFNKNNYIDAERENFTSAEEYENFQAKYSKLEVQKVSYDFTKDGEDWKGIYYYSFSKGKGYFIVTFECKADLFEKYSKDCEELIGDFRKESWATENNDKYQDDDGKKEELQYRNGELPNQITNESFYFQQGYLDTWEVTQQGSADVAIDEKTGLCLVLEPKANKGDVQYAIYVHTDFPLSLTDSGNSVLAKVMDEENDDFAFNKNNYIDFERAEFRSAENYENNNGKFSKLEMQKVSYDFTKDDEAWKGVYYYSYFKGKAYFIVTFECKADLFDQYIIDCEELIGDFRKEGWY